MVNKSFFDASLQPSFFTKSVRLNRTELSIGGICSKSRDLAPKEKIGFAYFFNTVFDGRSEK